MWGKAQVSSKHIAYLASAVKKRVEREIMISVALCQVKTRETEGKIDSLYVGHLFVKGRVQLGRSTMSDPYMLGLS